MKLYLVALLCLGLFQTGVRCTDKEATLPEEKDDNRPTAATEEGQKQKLEISNKEIKLLAGDDDTLPADDKLRVSATETQIPEAQFVYNPYGVNDYRLGQFFGGHYESNEERQPAIPRSREPFYFYTRDEDEEIDEYDERYDGPIEPFSFNEERINLEHFEQKKKLGDAEFRHLERGDYLDPSTVDRDSFLVVTGGLFPNNEIFPNVPQLKFGKKAEIEFDKLRKRFQATLQRYPPYYLDDPEYDPYEEYDPYVYDPAPPQEVLRPSLPPYTDPPPRRPAKKVKPKRKPQVSRVKNKKHRKTDDVDLRRKNKLARSKFRPKPTRRPTKRPTRRPATRRPTTKRPRPTTVQPETPRARSFPEDVIDDLSIFGRRINFTPPKITTGDRIDQQFYGKAEHRKITPTPTKAPKRRRPVQRRGPKRNNYRPYQKNIQPKEEPVTEVPPEVHTKGVARVYHYSTFGNSGNMRGFAYTIVV